MSSSFLENWPQQQSAGPAPGTPIVYTLTDGSVVVRPLASYGLSGDDGFWINLGLNLSPFVRLLPADYSLGSQVLFPPGGAEMNGPFAARLIPQAGLAGTPMVALNNFSRISGFQIFGGTTTRANNPACDAITLASANVIRWAAQDLYISYTNGWMFNPPALTVATHGALKTMRGFHTAGGYRIAAATNSAQINILDTDIQQCELNEVLLIDGVLDVLIDMFNCSILGSAGLPTWHIRGSAASIICSNLDIGVQGTPTAGVGVLLIEDSGGNSPNDIFLMNGDFQFGGVGAIVNGAAQRLKFCNIGFKQNQGDGYQDNGTTAGANAGHSLIGCRASSNNLAAGTAYDVNVTSTARVGLDLFSYESSAVTAGRNITLAGNHVTDANPSNPAGRGTAGNAPAGW